MNKLLCNHKERKLCAIQLLLLLCIITWQQLFPLTAGHYIFGSQGDWYSQHVAIGETLRQTMLETHSLLPQYLSLGGGSSIYDAAYYGVLRPDIIFSCFFSEVPMKYIIAGYALLGVYSSGILCFFWMKKCKIPSWFSFMGAVIFISSACFYQAHNQIMFINYMPFLVLALWGVLRVFEKDRIDLLTLALFLIDLHSFYYAPSCLCAVGIYGVYLFIDKKEERRFLLKRAGRFITAVLISIGMAMVLLLPTAWNILHTSKDAGRFGEEALKWIDPGVSGLLYSPYSCGMTILTLYCLLLGLLGKGKRFLACILLICVTIPPVSLILNGFLYARAKILIPFTPLFAFFSAYILWKLWTKEIRQRPFLLLLCLIPAYFSECGPLVLLDTIFLLAWIFLQVLFRNRRISIRKCEFILCICIPVYLNFAINSTTQFVEKTDTRQEWPAVLKEENIELKEEYRLEVNADGFVNSNLIGNAKIQRTSMYSSITNGRYAKFFYDTMKNAISYNNRVALVPGNNPCFNYFMGIRYLITKKGQVPQGYQMVKDYGDYALSENPDVLPICYGTTRLLEEEDYKKLKFPDNIEALCSNAVVKQGNSGTTFMTHFKEEKPQEFLGLQKPLSDKILILQFQVKCRTGQAVKISINGTKNKLSSEKAPYPNHNDTFTYILDAGENLQELSIQASKGDYHIENLKIYTADKKEFFHKDITIPKVSSSGSEKEEIFSGSIDMKEDGYFITSFPYRKGYKVRIDGKEVQGEVVNTAFLGFPITNGMHSVSISYEAPGYAPGRFISILSFGTYGCMLSREFRKKYRGEKNGKKRKN